MAAGGLKLCRSISQVPVLYDDPWTHETMMRFRERHQDPDCSDLEYAARINNYASSKKLIAAHAGSPWFFSMVGFVAGLPFLYQMVKREHQIQVPKYLRPRTDTPKQTAGHGGCFDCIYYVPGAGGYQMFGITPMPIYDPKQEIPYLRDVMVFFQPGDIVQWQPIDRAAHDGIASAVVSGQFVPQVREVTFSLDDYNKDIDGYNRTLGAILHGH